MTMKHIPALASAAISALLPLLLCLASGASASGQGFGNQTSLPGFKVKKAVKKTDGQGDNPMEAAPALPKGASVQVKSFPGALPKIDNQCPQLEYDFDLFKERFCIYVPSTCSKKSASGLIVYIHPDKIEGVPQQLIDCLERRRLIFVSPENAGNDQKPSRRAGLAVLAAYKMAEIYKIDRRRVYSCGLSGGGVVASYLPLVHPEMFTGAIPVCGAVAYRQNEDTEAQRGGERTFAMATGMIRDIVGGAMIEKARAAKVRYSFITGKGDSFYPEIFKVKKLLEEDGIPAQVVDVPGMKHELCSSQSLSEALDFIEKDQGK